MINTEHPYVNQADLFARRRRWRRRVFLLFSLALFCLAFKTTCAIRGHFERTRHPNKFWYMEPPFWDQKNVKWDEDGIGLMFPRSSQIISPTRPLQIETNVAWVFRAGNATDMTMINSPNFTYYNYRYWMLDANGVMKWGLAIGTVGFILWFRFCRKSYKDGFCENCGYDLRATPERCPECGTVVSGRSAVGGGR